MKIGAILCFILGVVMVAAAHSAAQDIPWELQGNFEAKTISAGIGLALIGLTIHRLSCWRDRLD